MTYVDNLAIKPQVLLPGFAEALKDVLQVSQLVTKRNDVDKYFLAEGDVISQRVKGTLPVRHYALRNSRSQPIIADTYKETVVKTTIEANRAYSAVKLTDEQLMWDFPKWGGLLESQAETLGDYFEKTTLNKILSAPYERVIVVHDTDAAVKAEADMGRDVWFNAAADATQALKLMRTPSDTVYALAGTNFANKLRKSQKLVKDQGLGGEALSSAAIGVVGGITFVESIDVPADEAHVFLKSGVVLYSAASPVPSSVPFGQVASVGGWALRHLMDYDSDYLTDRSVFDALYGSQYTIDRIAAQTKSGNMLVSENEYFVRGVKLVLETVAGNGAEKKPGDGSNDTPGGDPQSFLAKAYNQVDINDPEFIGKPFPLGGNYPGDKLTATATVKVEGGKVVGFAIDASGLGYTGSPVVTITGAGTGATAVATVANGQVTGIFVTAAGSGYDATTTVTIAAP